MAKSKEEGVKALPKGIYYKVLSEGRSSSARLLPEGRKNPHFNRNKFQFEFQNGEVLRLKLYEHLKV